MNKTIIILLLSFGIFTNIESNPKKQKPDTKKEIICQNNESSFIATLEPKNFERGSGLYDIENAFVRYNYSTAKLICENNDPKNLKCIGYWDNSDEIAQLKTFYTQNKIKVVFKTIKSYKNLTVELDCKIMDMK